MSEMTVGGLYRFGINPFALSSLDGRLSVYLGEAFIHRDDGVTVENHKVLLVGASKPTIIDRGCLKYMNEIT
jgi:hypothetical protein